MLTNMVTLLNFTVSTPKTIFNYKLWNSRFTKNCHQFAEEKRLQHRCFPVKFAKFLKTPFLKNVCERLLLSFISIAHQLKEKNSKNVRPQKKARYRIILRWLAWLLFSRNQVFCLKIWKIWRAPTTLQFNIFRWNFAYVSLLPMSTKGYSGFFYFV